MLGERQGVARMRIAPTWKVRRVLRLQKGHSQPTSKRSSSAWMLWATACSEAPRRVALAERTWRFSSSVAARVAWHSHREEMLKWLILGGFLSQLRPHRITLVGPSKKNPARHANDRANGIFVGSRGS